MANRAGAPAPVLGANRLGGVFDDDQPVFLSDLHHRIHVGHLAVEMHGNDGAGVGRYLRLD